MSLYRCTAFLALAAALATPTLARAQCADLPKVTVGKLVKDVVDVTTGELGGRPYELVLLKKVRYEDYKNKAVVVQLPAPETAAGDPVQLTAGEAIHLVVGSLGSGGGTSTTTTVILVIVMVGFGFGWWTTWQKLKAIQLPSDD